MAMPGEKAGRQARRGGDDGGSLCAPVGGEGEGFRQAEFSENIGGAPPSARRDRGLPPLEPVGGPGDRFFRGNSGQTRPTRQMRYRAARIG